MNKRAEPLRMRPSPWDVPKQNGSQPATSTAPVQRPGAVPPSPTATSSIQGHHVQPIAPTSHVTSVHKAAPITAQPTSATQKPFGAQPSLASFSPTPHAMPVASIQPNQPASIVHPSAPVATPAVPAQTVQQPPATLPVTNGSATSPSEEKTDNAHNEIFIDQDGNLIMK
jgi:hypothetical protein